MIAHTHSMLTSWVIRGTLARLVGVATRYFVFEQWRQPSSHQYGIYYFIKLGWVCVWGGGGGGLLALIADYE